MSAPEYKCSAPALHAAQVLLQHFEIIETSEAKIKATPENLAKLIDVHTLSMNIVPTTKAMANLNYLDAGAMEHNIDALRQHMDSIELLDEKAAHWEGEEQVIYDQFGVASGMSPWQRRQAKEDAREYDLSAQAVYATRELGVHFDFIERPDGRIRCTEKNIAHLIDVCTGVWRMLDAVSRLCSLTRNQSKQGLMNNLVSIKSAIRVLDYARMSMPANEGMEQIDRNRDLLPHSPNDLLTPEQRRNRIAVTRALSKSRTPEEDKLVIQNARYDKLI